VLVEDGRICSCICLTAPRECDIGLVALTWARDFLLKSKRGTTSLYIQVFLFFFLYSSRFAFVLSHFPFARL